MKRTASLGVFGIALLVGVASAVAVLWKGHGLFGTTDYVPWGILISSYEFLAASSTGLCIIAGTGVLLGIEPFAGLAKRLLGLAAALLMGGFMIIGLELGNPLKAVYMLISPNFTSAIFWMVSIYGVYMAFLLGTLLVIHLKKEGMVKAAAAAVTLIAVIATANMGVLLGTLQARPFWHGAFLPVYFIVTALYCGGAFVLVALYAREGAERALGVVRPLFRVLLLLTAALVVFKMGSAMQGELLAKQAAAKTLLVGPLKWNFWLGEIGLGILLPLVLVAKAGGSNGKLFVAAMSSLAGVFVMRYDLVVAGLLVPLELIDVAAPVKSLLIYSPSLAEIGIVVGGLGLAGLAYTALERTVDLDQAISK